MTAGKAVVIEFRKLSYLNNRSEQDGFFMRQFYPALMQQRIL